ncbi:MAG: GIDE domain-containing protein [Stenotrophobium sp.]
MNALILHAGSGSFIFWLVCGGAVTLALFAFGFMQLSRARLLEDTPTSLIRSAAQGYVELCGHAGMMPGPEILSPLSDTRCVWWSYRVEHRERDGDKTRWVTVENRTSDDLFLLCDTTGDCVIDPDGASIMPSLRRSWSGPTPRPHRGPEGGWLSFGDYRYHERLIKVGDLLYATGWFHSQGAERAFDEPADVRDLLADWKKNRADLLKRFDANHDGQIDMQEWEAARAAALAEVREHEVQNSINPDVHVLSKPRDARPYIISTLSQRDLMRRYRWFAVASVIAAFALGIFCARALELRGGL